VVVSTTGDDYRRWANVLKATQFVPGIVLPCYQGHAPFDGRPCFNTETEFPEITWLRGELQAGRIKAFAETETQYVGILPSDPRMEPFWQLAEEFDVPIGIHMGPGPPGVAYDYPLPPPVRVKSPAFRMTLGDPLLLEEVLLKHQRLRLYVMHAGYPRLESMIALMYAHPAVYVDTAALQSERVIPRTAYYRYLRELVEAGFAGRIMFGSDFPDQAAAGIDAILAADFLTAQQKADILCGNAARFLRLDPAICH
jgi:predicted TIM-barrel fold metal-dependent hydrolase